MRTPLLASSIDHKTNKIIGWSLLIGLLILRIPFLGFTLLFTKPIWLDPIFEIGTYFLTACLIWLERDCLADYHIDRLALVIIILIKPVQTIILNLMKVPNDPLAIPSIGGIIIWIISIGLFIALAINRPQLAHFSRYSFLWFGLGLIIGLFTAILLGYPMSIQIRASIPSGGLDISNLLRETFPSFFYQLGYAAVSEEPLFRGFLWGYLRKIGWKNIWILIFQMILFMVGHIYFITKAPISFWIIVPIGGLMLGLLVWRSKTISSSLAAHATVNTFAYLIGYVFYTFTK